MKTLLLGDLSPTVYNRELFRTEDIPSLFNDATGIFEGKDFVCVNLECALTEHDTQIKKFGPALKAPRETASVLKRLGVKLAALSNNHIFDFGIKGATDTLSALSEYGIDYTGFGENYEDSRKTYTVQADDEKIAIIDVCEHEYSYALPDRMGARPYDEYDTMLDIREAKKTHDRVIVLYHGGKEFCRYPSPRLYRLCHAMAKHGADVVLCQHSHCIGAYERFEGCHILYGQGNFHFVRPHEFDGWSTSLATEYDTKTNEIRFVPLQNTDCGIRLAPEGEAEKIMDGFKARSEELLTGTWRQGWHAFCESLKDFYTQTVTNAYTPHSEPIHNEHFAHYLDCEAHTDVYRELFQTYNQTNEK